MQATHEREFLLSTTDPELQWVLAAADAAADKLGSDIVIIDVEEVLAITGYFVIVSGRNTRQARAIGQEIEDQLVMLNGPRPTRIEGRAEGEWLLMDYGDFVVHVFEESAREYYDLARLWSDQPRVPWTAPEESRADADA